MANSSGLVEGLVVLAGVGDAVVSGVLLELAQVELPHTPLAEPVEAVRVFVFGLILPELVAVELAVAVRLNATGLTL